MNLTELQVELRSIEDHISSLHSEVEKMKQQNDQTKNMASKIDFNTITKMARQHPISGLSICIAPEFLKKEFISGLAYLSVIEQDDINSRLLYLCRLALGCNLELTAEDIYRFGLEFNDDDIEKISVELQEYKYTYLVEAFIIANLSEKTPVNMLAAIADMANLMGCDKEEIRVIAQVAKSKLLNNPDVLKYIPLQSKNRWSGKFKEYIPKEWIVGQRQRCGTIRTVRARFIGWLFGQNAGSSDRYEDDCVIKSKPQSGSVVKKGEPILVYEGDALITHEKKTETILAPMDGIVYFVDKKKSSTVSGYDDKYVSAYVISYFDDYNDFIRNVDLTVKDDEYKPIF